MPGTEHTETSQCEKCGEIEAAFEIERLGWVGADHETLCTGCALNYLKDHSKGRVV